MGEDHGAESDYYLPSDLLEMAGMADLTPRHVRENSGTLYGDYTPNAFKGNLLNPSFKCLYSASNRILHVLCTFESPSWFTILLVQLVESNKESGIKEQLSPMSLIFNPFSVCEFLGVLDRAFFLNSDLVETPSFLKVFKMFQVALQLMAQVLEGLRQIACLQSLGQFLQLLGEATEDPVEHPHPNLCQESQFHPPLLSPPLSVVQALYPAADPQHHHHNKDMHRIVSRDWAHLGLQNNNL